MKHLILIPLIALFTQQQGLAQFAPELQHAADQVDPAGSYFQLSKMGDDIEVFTQYLDLSIEIAREAGVEDIPEGINIAKCVEALGLGSIQAVAQSARFEDGAWTNRCYVQSDAMDKGLFALLGPPAKDYTVTSFAPAGTDLAIQIPLVLNRLEQTILTLGEGLGTPTLGKDLFNEPLTDTGSETCGDLIKQTSIMFSLVMKLDENDPIDMGVIKTSRPDITIRVDGMNKIWDAFIKDILMSTDLAFQISEKDGIATWCLPEEMEKKYQVAPVLVVDQRAGHIWISTGEDFLNQCRSPKKLMKDTPEFKATWKQLSEQGNMMLYGSLKMVKEVEKQYLSLVEQQAVPAHIIPLCNRFFSDVTRTKTGFGLAVSKDDKGVHIESRTPFPVWLPKVAAVLTLLGVPSEEATAEPKGKKEIK